MKTQIALLLLFSNLVWSQEAPKKPFRVRPEFYHAFVINSFQGDNYLAKGHKSNSVGGQFKVNVLHYYNFKLGTLLEKSTLKVSDVAIGGNIDKTNINSVGGVISYSLELTPKIRLEPEVHFSGVELRQKSGSKLYGVQNGSKLGLGIGAKYKLYRKIYLFSTIGYNKYFFETNTSPEYEDYFNNSNAVNYSLGFTIN